MISVLASCGKEGKSSLSSAEKTICDELNQKYGISVQMKSIEEIYGAQTFEEGRYHAVVQEKGKENTFDAYLGMKSRVLKDNYPKLIYGDQIDEVIQDILAQHIQTEQISYEMIYCADVGTWMEEHELRDYLEMSDTYINISLELDKCSAEFAAQKFYDTAEKLKEAGFHFSIKCVYQNCCFYLIDNKYVSLMSYEEILVKLKGDT